MESEYEVRGPWSLATGIAFWKGFAPSALRGSAEPGSLRSVFLCDADWRRVEVVVTQRESIGRIAVTGPGDLEAATAQVLRFLSLDVDARGWPQVGERDPIIAAVQRKLPGFRPCGFHSPYEAAVWAVMSQRLTIRQAASMMSALAAQEGDGGALPTPNVLRDLTLDLPGRKPEYLHAVSEAALDGRLDGAELRDLPAAESLAQVQAITGIGPFSAELSVLRGAGTVDVLPRHEKRLEAELLRLYGAAADLSAVTARWEPFRTWAAVHLRAASGLQMTS